jgi:3-hydroxyacyl-[acyl-carrier-protein] dehydratase
LVSGIVTRRFAEEHPAAEGHFPGNPIIPGAVSLREIVAAISRADDAPDGAAAGCEIRSAKFHRPVRRGDTLVVSRTSEAEGTVRFSCAIVGSDRQAMSGALRLPPP